MQCKMHFFPDPMLSLINKSARSMHSSSTLKPSYELSFTRPHPAQTQNSLSINVPQPVQLQPSGRA